MRDIITQLGLWRTLVELFDFVLYEVGQVLDVQVDPVETVEASQVGCRVQISVQLNLSELVVAKLKQDAVPTTPAPAHDTGGHDLLLEGGPNVGINFNPLFIVVD